MKTTEEENNKTSSKKEIEKNRKKENPLPPIETEKKISFKSSSLGTKRVNAIPAMAFPNQVAWAKPQTKLQ